MLHRYRFSRLTLIGLLFASLLFAGCHINGPEEEGRSFFVTVTDSVGRPLDGVTVRGGVLQGSFLVRSDAMGRVELPAVARNEVAWIEMGNFLPLRVPQLHGSHYTLSPAPLRMVAVGSAPGEVVYLENGAVLTLEESGIYHYTQFTPGPVTALSTVRLLPASARVDAWWYADRHLWVASDTRLYRVDCSSPTMPRMDAELTLPYALRRLAVRDSLFAVAPKDLTTLAFLRLDSTGTITESSRLPLPRIEDVWFDNASVVVLGDGLPIVVDLRDPNAPTVRARGAERDNAWRGWKMKDTLFAMQVSLAGDSWLLRAKLLGSDPVSTVREWRLPFLPRGVLSGGWAFGTLPESAVTVFSSLESPGTVMATVAVPPSRVRASSPPWFFIDDRIWKMNK